ncbi:ABC transporter ATP-binding protein [Agarivorans sp. B2Z047]|uniref:elongation factor P hydroxylase n=1 Tax=Agarivorans sp. B2Z047 TaxID=2652721 RepID=UPI00128B2CA7|nr:elongation factor P hydroxylase [Agarivorans sp. B2Z047]MPW28619.1 ABC transporter ATP-binding protein [Agarivorans sp. B2Z047]UQN41180.1 elongation factor P hydroxylase [Agarivorans sp. B2Z047]
MLDDVKQLILLFNETFDDLNTELVAGEDEPIYLPAGEGRVKHQIVFAHGFYASALHEIAHWCIAGEQRRQLEDYGYWYKADGRNQQQQLDFEKVEYKPQAVECGLARAAGRTFQVSVDNLSGFQSDRHAFAAAVEEQYQLYLQQGFPARAQKFITVLNKANQALVEVAND